MSTTFEALIDWAAQRAHMRRHREIAARDLPKDRIGLARLHAQLHSKTSPAPPKDQHTHGGPVLSVEIGERHFLTQPLGIFEGTYIGAQVTDYTALRQLAAARPGQAKAAAGRRPAPRPGQAAAGRPARKPAARSPKSG